MLDRYRDSGGDIGGWVTQEIRDEQLKPLLDALEKELAATAGQSVQAATAGPHSRAGAGARPPTWRGRCEIVIADIEESPETQ